MSATSSWTNMLDLLLLCRTLVKMELNIWMHKLFCKTIVPKVSHLPICLLLTRGVFQFVEYGVLVALSCSFA